MGVSQNKRVLRDTEIYEDNAEGLGGQLGHVRTQITGF